MTKRIGLLGAGRIGTHHAYTFVNDVPGATLVAIADPNLAAAQKLADNLKVNQAFGTLEDLLAVPDLDGVVVASPAATHPEVIKQILISSLPVFAEKPLATTLPDAQDLAETIQKSQVPFQIGFNRRYAESWQQAKSAVKSGRVGQIQLMRSLTRDPGPYQGDAHRTPLNTIFNETLIHDFDTLNWLNEEAQPVSAYTVADALIVPEAKDQGFLDTAIVTIKYDNGALATAEASFSAVYGYDLRAEIFGNQGMVQAGTPQVSRVHFYGKDGLNVPTWGSDTSKYHQSYVEEFKAFTALISGEEDENLATTRDGLIAQAVADAAIRSFQSGQVEKVNL